MSQDSNELIDKMVADAFRIAQGERGTSFPGSIWFSEDAEALSVAATKLVMQYDSQDVFQPIAQGVLTLLAKYDPIEQLYVMCSVFAVVARRALSRLEEDDLTLEEIKKWYKEELNAKEG